MLPNKETRALTNKKNTKRSDVLWNNNMIIHKDKHYYHHQM